MRLLNYNNGLKLLMALVFAGLTACGGGEDTKGESSAATDEKNGPSQTAASADPAKSIGVGPVKHVELGEIDQDMVAEGLVIFEGKCSACHKIEQRYVGPPLAGVTERRTPEWIMNMILNPEEMVKKDPQARALLAEYMAPMADQGLSEEEARKILEYFRTLEKTNK